MGYAARRKQYSVLYEIASEQSGVFTAKQAVEDGFDARNHPYHVKAGYWEKAHRGIYRLVQFPIEPSMQYAVWSLWSCNREDKPQGVYSHETALSIYDLSDLDPPKPHMTGMVLGEVQQFQRFLFSTGEHSSPKSGGKEQATE